ncbi:MAG TPA: alpha/beta fold hydrolase [Kofleriaceae bacterium]
MSALRARLEVAAGGAQFRAIAAAARAIAGLRTKLVDGVAYDARPGTPAKLPLATIHGFGGDKETWLMLAALVPRARGLANVDLPGHGASWDVPEAHATLRHHAEAVIRVLDAERIDRAIVCGNSMGGGVALRLAASWPDRVAGLVLVDSVGRDVHEGGRAWIDGDNPLIPTEADVDRFMAIAMEQPPPVGRSVIRYVITRRARAAGRLKKLFRGFVLAPGELGVPRDLDGISVPALVIHGEQDRVIDRRTSEDLANALPRGELVVLRGVGHVPQLEAPRATAKLVERFARTLDSR